MSAEKHNIESLFQDTLQNAELPVDPAIWQGVSAGISGAATGAAGAGAASGLGMAAKVAIGVVVAASVATGAWFVTRPDAPEQQAAIPVVTPDEPVAQSIEEQPSAQTQDAAETVEFQSAQQDLSDAQPETDAQAPSTPDPVQPEATPEGEVSSPPAADTTPEQTPDITDDPMHQTPEFNPEHMPAVPTPDENLSAVFDTVRMDPVVPQYVLQAEYDAAHSYRWLIDGAEVSTARQFAHLFDEAGLVEVTLITADRTGAEQQYTLAVDVPEVPESSVTPANVFSPGTDAYNNTYDLEAMSEHCTLLRMQVFDRSGNLVFETDADTRTWDGTDLYGNNCPSGRYLIKYWMRGDDGVMHDGRADVTLFAP